MLFTKFDLVHIFSHSVTMSRCYALKNNLLPCRNYGMVVERTEDTILYSPYCKNHQREKGRIYTVSLEFHDRIRNYMERGLKDGVLEITEEFIKNLSQRVPHRNVTFFILLVARWVPEFKRDWCPNIFDRALGNLLVKMESEGPLEVTMKDIITMARCVGTPSEGFFAVLKGFPEERAMYDPSRDKWYGYVIDMLNSEWGTCVKLDSNILESKNWDSMKEFCRVRHMSNLVPLVQSGLLYDMVKKAKEDLYEDARKRMGGVKEELFEITWGDPTWVKDWCMDWESQKDWNQRWGEKNDAWMDLDREVPSPLS